MERLAGLSEIGSTYLLDRCPDRWAADVKRVRRTRQRQRAVCCRIGRAMLLLSILTPLQGRVLTQRSLLCEPALS